jgi:hypothetical protein
MHIVEASFREQIVINGEVLKTGEALFGPKSALATY